MSHFMFKAFLNATLLIVLFAIPTSSPARSKSVCYGTPSQGRLENGWKLPLEGENFVAYTQLGGWLNRTYVHSSVYQIVIDAYHALAKQTPDKIYMYGETGWAYGGSFKPHKTHQNGLSVDFMVSILNDQNMFILGWGVSRSLARRNDTAPGAFSRGPSAHFMPQNGIEIKTPVF